MGQVQFLSEMTRDMSKQSDCMTHDIFFIHWSCVICDSFSESVLIVLSTMSSVLNVSLDCAEYYVKCA
jgi:hypothetical protein